MKKGPIEKGADTAVSRAVMTMQRQGAFPRGATQRLLSPLALELARQCYLNGIYAGLVVAAEQASGDSP